MNSRFEKWQKQLYDPNVSKEEREATLEELHKSFAMLSQEEQKYANIFLHDIQSGDAKLGKESTRHLSHCTSFPTTLLVYCPSVAKTQEVSARYSALKAQTYPTHLQK